MMAASLSLLLALQFSSETGRFDDCKFISFFAFSVIFLGCFAARLKLGDDVNCIIPRGLRNETVLLSAAMGFFILLAEYSLLYYLPFYFQVSPLHIHVNGPLSTTL